MNKVYALYYFHYYHYNYHEYLESFLLNVTLNFQFQVLEITEDISDKEKDKDRDRDKDILLSDHQLAGQVSTIIMYIILDEISDVIFARYLKFVMNNIFGVNYLLS